MAQENLVKASLFLHGQKERKHARSARAEARKLKLIVNTKMKVQSSSTPPHAS